MPFVLVGDEAFALSEHVLRSYHNKKLTCVILITTRLSGARWIVECTFGILAHNWRIFHRPIDVKLDFCDIIKLAAFYTCTFYVRKNDGIQFNGNVPWKVYILFEQWAEVEVLQ